MLEVKRVTRDLGLEMVRPLSTAQLLTSCACRVKAAKTSGTLGEDVITVKSSAQETWRSTGSLIQRS